MGRVQGSAERAERAGGSHLVMKHLSRPSCTVVPGEKVLPHVQAARAAKSDVRRTRAHRQSCPRRESSPAKAERVAGQYGQGLSTWIVARGQIRASAAATRAEVHLGARNIIASEINLDETLRREVSMLRLRRPNRSFSHVFLGSSVVVFKQNPDG